MKKKYILAITIVISIFFSINKQPVVLADTQTINAAATIPSWLTMSVSTTSAIISPNLVSTAGIPAIGTSNIFSVSAGTNSTSGLCIFIQSNGQLTNGTDTIKSIGYGTTSVLAGIDRYGIQASSSNGMLSNIYKWWTDDTIGFLPATSTASLINVVSPGTTQIDLRIKASSTTIKKAGTYTDSIILTILTNP